MTIRYNGRNIYLDAPATYNDITIKNAKIDQIRLVAGTTAAVLTVFANTVTTDDTKRIATLKAAIEGTDEYNPSDKPEQVNDSQNGLSCVLTGTAAVAHIILA